MPLGKVKEDGALALLVRAESIDQWGVANVPCPRCGRVKVWFPQIDQHVVKTLSNRLT
jgi:4-hydroxy-3-methylbut-2-en-1-yl diphosphate synthase IspG/GcpE